MSALQHERVGPGMCPPTTTCVLILLYVSSYYYIRVLIQLYMQRNPSYEEEPACFTSLSDEGVGDESVENEIEGLEGSRKHVSVQKWSGGKLKGPLGRVVSLPARP